MRHKYETPAIVLARTPLGEANTLVTLLTPSVGLVRARAQGLRKPGAKLAAALATLAESNVVLVRGKEGWRVAGAVLEESWFARLPTIASRTCAARVSGLVLRLVAGESGESETFAIVKGFLQALVVRSEESSESVELLAVARLLASLGLGAEQVPGASDEYDETLLGAVAQDRAAWVQRINRGIAASGL